MMGSEHQILLYCYQRCLGAVFSNSHKKLYAILVPDLFAFFADETLSLHVKFFKGTCLMFKATMCCLSKHVTLCCIATVTDSAFSGVQTEHKRLSDLLTRLPQTMKLSA
jgi:hypothetical protein